MRDASYDAVVYDLDGTLVHLDVDWGAVASDVLGVYESAAVDVPSRDLWDLLLAAPEYGLADPVEAAIAAHERDGARTATRLATADDVATQSVPVGVCSLNCEAACRIALESHGLLTAVETVVGRDTVETQKPDPEPLLAAVDGLEATPERALFVGDTRRDKLTADRAGTAFAYVDGGPRTY
ncbi:HAD family hydrolase [Natronobiforma cellulositropha]|uniref:HAD family hydrolase n=1 Tax=Natronobiforma cellulositropha TaxID=1679076 RepID=UPI0021D5E80F|nr:HAD hydrolase-like protein [Natronobiforma cellulositropha]